MDEKLDARFSAMALQEFWQARAQRLVARGPTERGGAIGANFCRPPHSGTDARAGSWRSVTSRQMNCPYCQGALTQIDYYDEVLTGCVDCNRWGKPDHENLVMELIDEDYEALRKLRGLASDHGRRNLK